MTTTKRPRGTNAASAKKGSAPKRNLKKSKRVLVQAQGEQCFWANNGYIISTLIDLSNLLSSIEKEVFEYHVRKDKNDFADWVEFVLGDAELAKGLRKARKPKAAQGLVVKRLKIYDI
jgi:hypothetical protein